MSGIGVGFFHLGSTDSVLITNQTALRSTSGVSATATYRLGNDGIAYKTNNPGAFLAISGEWLVSGTDTDFEAQATWGSVSGGTTGGPTGWTSLGTINRDWTLTVSAGGGLETGSLSVEIRKIGTTTVLTSATITFTVNSA